MRAQRSTCGLLALFAFFAACGEGVSGGPVPPVTSDQETPEVPDVPPDESVKRVVSQRNPYGNVAVTDNLLWDGDFEFRPSFPEQYGWLIGYGFGVGFGLPPLATGARCRSGIKCAELGPGQHILGIAVGSEGDDLLVSFWAYPDDGTCDGVGAGFISQYGSVEAGERIEPVEPDPFEDGWCRFETVSPARTTAAYLSIENLSVTNVVIDDAVVRPIGNEERRARSLARAKPFSAAEEQRFEALRRSAHAARLPRRAPPSRGEQALSSHLRSLMR